ncbi:gem-associated protein 2 [Nephila pilipes]|uniref:Gem-associated protein 2 n=1 Tax=Nephila pilipes TaxID=299642 RepID=A0A8X6JB93_NEPPI|nr:gem-associated protein 2 [Nephila pilipes]
MDADEGMKIAFDVGEIPANFDYDAPPTTGIEYLHRVKLEKRKCPRVVVSNIDKTKYLSRQTVTIEEHNGFIYAPPGYEPDPDWKEEQLELFSNNKAYMSGNRAHLREKFAQKIVPKIHKYEEWSLYCLGSDKHRLLCNKHDSESSNAMAAEESKKSRFENIVCEPNPPLLSVMLYLSQRKIIKLLSYHINWLEGLGFSHTQGEWLYALLVALEKPLEPDTCSLLRNLSRICSQLRCNINSSDHEFVKPLNLILSIISEYFDQIDMSDNFIDNKWK